MPLLNRAVTLECSWMLLTYAVIFCHARFTFQQSDLPNCKAEEFICFCPNSDIIASLVLTLHTFIITVHLICAVSCIWS